MAMCPGKRKNGSNCSSTLFRCKKCGKVGCDQATPQTCSNQGFANGKCQQCGTSGQKEQFR